MLHKHTDGPLCLTTRNEDRHKIPYAQIELKGCDHVERLKVDINPLFAYFLAVAIFDFSLSHNAFLRSFVRSRLRRPRGAGPG